MSACLSMSQAADSYVVVTRVDWIAVFKDFNEAGVTNYRVMKVVGTKWSTLAGWARKGSEPKHSFGEAVRAFYLETFGLEKTILRFGMSRYNAKKL